MYVQYTYMKAIQQILLIEVIQFLVQHGADVFNLKCLKTGKTTYDFALQNQQDASKNNPNFNKDCIENKIIDVLLNTKQVFFHPQLLKPGEKKGQNNNQKAGKYRQSKTGHYLPTVNTGNQYNPNWQQSNNLPETYESSQRDMMGCCGCSSLFQNLCNK